VLGRYAQADPLGIAAGANLYPYVDSDPLNLVDPRGEIPLFLITGGIGFLAGGAGNLANQLWRNGGRWECVDWSDFFIAAGVGGVTGLVAPVAAPGYLCAIGLGGISGVAQTTLSNAANGVPTTSNDVLLSAGIGAAAGAIGGGVGAPPGGKYPSGIYKSDLISHTGDAAFDCAMNEYGRARGATATSNFLRSGLSRGTGNFDPKDGEQ